MVKEIYSVSDDVYSFSSSSSEESFSYLLYDKENPNHNVSDEWRKIERTLYEENGVKVSNEALLKECKLWSVTFPHLRLCGSEVAVQHNGSINQVAQTSPQGMAMLQKKREEIKQKVVNNVVMGLIDKFKSSNNFAKSMKMSKNKMNEIEMNVNNEDCIEHIKRQDIDLKQPKCPLKPILKSSPKKQVVKAHLEKRYSDKKKEIVIPSEAEFKMNSKYEGMLATVLHNSDLYQEFGLPHNLKAKLTSTKSKDNSDQMHNNFDEYLKRHKKLPQIGQFQNNWMAQRDQNRIESEVICVKSKLEKMNLQRNVHKTVHKSLSSRDGSSKQTVVARVSKSSGLKKLPVTQPGRQTNIQLPPIESSMTCTPVAGNLKFYTKVVPRKKK